MPWTRSKIKETAVKGSPPHNVVLVKDPVVTMTAGKKKINKERNECIFTDFFICPIYLSSFFLFYRFIGTRQNLLCKHEDDCTQASKCDGLQATCPLPQTKPDNVTECNEGTQVCRAGECKSSICVKFQLAPCFLTSDSVTDKRQLCELACQKSGFNQTCMSTSELVSKGFIRDLTEGLSLRPGSPCDNFQVHKRTRRHCKP